LVLGLAIGATACGPAVVDGTGGDSSTGSAETTTSSTMPSTNTSAPSTTLDDTSTTTIADDSSSTDDVDDSAGSFYAVRPDGGGGPLDCDPFAQDCPPDEKCNAWAMEITWDSFRCVPLSDSPDATGDPCTVAGGPFSGIDSCALGAMCFHVDPDTNVGTCVAQCINSFANPLCAADDERCVELNDVLRLCLPECDPLADDCADGQTCAPDPESGGFLCFDSPDQDGGQGQSCENPTTCAPGLACSPGDQVLDCPETACCTAFCDTTSGEPCPGADMGVTCEPFYDEDPPQGLETVGVCVLPN